MPRPTKLTPARTKAILDVVRKGNYFTTACHAAGLSENTGNAWLDRGREELARLDAGLTDADREEHGYPPAHQEAPYARFAQAVENARAEAEVRVVSFIHKTIEGGFVKEKRKDPETGEIVTVHAAPDGKLGLEWLSRVAAARFARRQSLEVSGPDGGPIGVDASAGARLAARLEPMIRRMRENPQVIEGQVVRRAIAAGSDGSGSVVFDERADNAGGEPEGGGEGEPDGAAVRPEAGRDRVRDRPKGSG